MTTITSAERERQRVDHLVLGRPRPAPVIGPKPKGLSKGEWRVQKEALRAAGQTLLPGIEERVQIRERFSHKQGTAETHDHLDRELARPGSLARLLTVGTIDKDQLAAAIAIRDAHGRVTAAVRVRTASLEARVDSSSHGKAEGEQLGAVWAELAYTWWRSAIAPFGDLLLAVIVDDVGLTIAARRHGLGMARARRLLTEALDLWAVGHARTGSAARAATRG